MLDIKEYLRQTKTVLITQDAFDELKQRAFTQPEIIHCKDCAHYGGYGFCYEVDGLWHDEDYCSRAERRKE